MNYLFAAILIASLTSTSVFAACPVNVGRGAKYCENGYWWKCENCAGVDCGILQAGDGACFSGEWRGYATFGSGRFNYEWSIRQHGPSADGSITISRADGSQRSSYRFDGTVQGERLSFRGTQWITANAGTWCIASGELRISRPRGGVELSGSWGSNPVAGGCPSGGGGEIYLLSR